VTKPADGDLIYLRESHMVVCEACGYARDDWDGGITVREAVERATADPAALDDLFTRACPKCGCRIEWDVAVVADPEVGTLSADRQGELAEEMRRLISAGADPQTIVNSVQRDYAVIAFYVGREPTVPEPR
jgi:hypothetical protein